MKIPLVFGTIALVLLGVLFRALYTLATFEPNERGSSMAKTSREVALKRVAGFMREMLLGNLPYMKKSDRIGLIVNLLALGLLIAGAVWSAHNRQ